MTNVSSASKIAILMMSNHTSKTANIYKFKFKSQSGNLLSKADLNLLTVVGCATQVVHTVKSTGELSIPVR